MGVNLDPFMYAPEGEIVGISKNDGSDELVEVALPVDGTWTVAVFGYATINLSVDYDLYSWVLSATPGGTLEFLEAPKSATSNKTEAIGGNRRGMASWRHLSHNQR